MGHLGAVFIVFLTVHSWDCTLGAPDPSTCPEHLQFRCSDGSCISRLSVCDGQAQCQDGSDEQQCGGPSGCKSGEFFCDIGRCISVHLVCDGVNNCDDGKDESFCQNCTSGSFACGPSSSCLSRDQLCDGTIDCEDGRDEAELFCGSRTSTCSASEFQCGDGQCIRHTFKCDNTWDCSDGTDEQNCDVNECLVNNGGCLYVCVDEPQGFHCECPNNTKLVGDSHCEEINTCLEADVCDQFCFHRNGHLACRCQDGYQVKSATGECRTKGIAARLLFTDFEGVKTTYVTGFDHKQLNAQLHGRGHMTALASNNTLFWAQLGHSSIYRFSINGKPRDAKLVLKSSSSVSGLAVDWIHRLLYWPSVEAGAINVGVSDGSVQHQLLTGLDQPCAVSVDPTQGLIFWAECGNSPKIERSSLDGQYRKTLVTTLIHQPVALSVDMPRQLLYWVDQGLRRISRVNFEGHYRKTVVESNGYLDQPFALAVFEGFVYWSDEVTHSICRANKHNGSQFQVLLKNVTLPGSVVISHPVLQPTRQAACGQGELVCLFECAVSVISKSLNISCSQSQNGQNTSEGFPAISRTVPVSASSDSTFAGLLALTMFLIIVLVGMFLWWCREEVRPHRDFEQSLSLKESRDPLIKDVAMHPRPCPTKDTLLKLVLDPE